MYKMTRTRIVISTLWIHFIFVTYGYTLMGYLDINARVLRRLYDKSPGINIQEVDIYKRVELIEEEIERDLNLPNLFLD